MEAERISQLILDMANAEWEREEALRQQQALDSRSRLDKWFVGFKEVADAGRNRLEAEAKAAINQLPQEEGSLAGNQVIR